MPFVLRPYRRFPLQCAASVLCKATGAGTGGDWRMRGGESILVPICLGALLLVAGCAGNPSAVDQGRASQIKLNISTKEDVRRVLGKPNSVSRHTSSYPLLPGVSQSTTLTNVEVWNYTDVTVDLDSVFIGLFTGGDTSKIHIFTVVYDEQGIVRHVSSTQSGGRSGTGSGDKWRPID
jgi:hypothetical protein